MRVWVVLKKVDYEGFYLQSVFSTEIKALAYSKTHSTKRSGERLVMEAVTVDDEAHKHEWH